MTLVAAPRASSTAPVPRPPQPIRPILISVTPAPPAACNSGASTAAAAPAMPSEVALRKSRREESAWEGPFGAFIVVKPPGESRVVTHSGAGKSAPIETRGRIFSIQDNPPEGPDVGRAGPAAGLPP